MRKIYSFGARVLRPFSGTAVKKLLTVSLALVLAVALLPITSFFPHSTAYADEGEDGEIGIQAAIEITFIVEGGVYMVYTEGAGLTACTDDNNETYYLSDTPYILSMPSGMVSFRGWFTENATSPFDFNTHITESITLIAQFSEAYLITFKDGNGTDVYTREYLPGAGILQPNQAVLDEVGLTAPAGSHLDYWFLEGGDPNVMFAFGTTTATANLTLLPRFSDNWYVIFVSAGTQVDPGVQQVTNGNYATRPSPNPSRPGYSFAHWSTTDNGTASFNFATTAITSDVMLYAVWTPLQVGYTVAIWMEKPNIAGTPTHVNGDKSQYNYVTSVPLTGLAGTSTAVYEDTPAISTEFINHEMLRYAEFQDAEQKLIQGNGLTVVNLYASRKVYTYKFDLGDNLYTNGGGAGTPAGRSMAINGTTYYAGAGQPQFTLQVKYEQDISDLFPVAGLDSVTFNHTLGSGFRSWAPDAALPNKDTHFASRCNTVDKSLLSSDGMTMEYTFTAYWIAEGNVFNYRYLAQVLPGQAVTPQNSITLGGITYMVMEDYSQAVQARLVQKVINGLNAVVDNYWSVSIIQDEYTYPYSDAGEFLLYTWSAADGFEAVDFLSADVTSDRLVFAGILEDTDNYRCFFYTRGSFSLTFDMLAPAGSVQNVPSNATLVYQQSIAPFEPAVDPSRDDYIFAGWYRDSDFMEEFDFGITMPNGPMIVYAKWVSNQNIVRFFDNYGSTNQVDQAGVANGEYVTNESYYTIGTAYPGLGEFKGWRFIVLNRLVPFSYDIPIWRDYDLYALWRTDGFTLTYDAGSGSGTVPVDNNTYELGTSARASQPGNGLIPPVDLMFYAWQSSNGAGIYYPGNLVPMYGDTVLTAQFAPEADLATFTFIENFNGSTTTFVIHPIIGSSITLVGEVFTRPGSGSRLVGWNTASNWTGTSYDLDQPGFLVSGDMTFYGVWDLADFTVTVNNSYAAVTGAGTYHFNDQVTINAGTRDGYNFNGWSVIPTYVTLANPATATTTFTMPADDVEATATWAPRTNTPYKVEHYLVSGTGSVTLADTDNRTGTTDTTVSAVPRTYAGYTYDPNYPDTVFSGIVAGDGSLVLKLYYTAGTAGYTVEHYLVSDAGVATLADTDNLTGATGTEVNAVARTYPGYTFVPNYTGTVSSGIVVGDGSLVLKLFYTAGDATSYKVEHYQVNAADLATLADTENLTGSTGNTVTAVPKVYTGYTYAPSYPDTVSSGTITGDGSLVLKLYYMVDAYTINYYGNNATAGSMASQTVTYNSSVTLSANVFTRLGYTFAGWNTQANGSGVAFTDQQAFTYFLTEDLDLYAQWNIVYYTVIYAPGTQGTWTAASQTYTGLTYGQATPAAPAITGNTGYVFGGWTPVRAATVTGNATYTATWYIPVVVVTASYTVNHYNADNGALLLADILTGTIGQTVTATPQSFPNYSYVASDARQVLSGVVLANGSLVLSLYYSPSGGSNGNNQNQPGTQDPPIVNPLPDQDVPLIGSESESTWALANLILSILGVLMALGLIVAYFVKTKKEEEQEDRRRRGVSEEQAAARQKRMAWRLVTLIFGIIALILFFLTEDISLAVGLVDYWTIAHAIIFILQIAFTALALKKKVVDVGSDDSSGYEGSPAL